MGTAKGTTTEDDQAHADAVKEWENELVTVREFVSLVGSTERTVRRDIAEGRLPVVRLHARALRVRRGCWAGYRPSPGADDRLTVAEVAKILGVSMRTMRNWIAQRRVATFSPPCGANQPVTWADMVWQASPRRLYFSKEELRNHGVLVDPLETAEGASDEEAVKKVIVPAIERAALKRGMTFHRRCRYLSIAHVARLGGLDRHTVNHHIRKGALQVKRFGRRGAGLFDMNAQIRIHIREAAVYLDLVPHNWERLLSKKRTK